MTIILKELLFFYQAERKLLTEMGFRHYISTENFPGCSLGRGGGIPEASITPSREIEVYL